MQTFLKSRALGMIVVLVCLGAVPSVVWLINARAPERPAVQSRDARYASQSGSRSATRKAQLATRGNEEVDSAMEACGGLGVERLAARYGVERRRTVVAKRFAKAYEPAYRAHAYEGCLAGLRHGG